MADLAQKRKTKVLHRRVPDVQTSNNADADADNSDDDDDVEDGGEHGVKDGWRTGRDLDSLAWPREEWRPFMGGRDFWADGSEWEGPGVRAAIMRWLERKKEDGRWYSKFI
ncbi:hypothetical protein BDV95DRAFT_578099 [Massariosphaeria phaeospora]|uniref:Uncharacterized protein n=1 Tax=Massariosphaeria phaeospora TaxID=100035 RepID=A0A7C8M6C7_9PLEO|nr:hypothetical protein BDV95DRAFT_578099 [Massariosphaeria phaeospora]